MASKKVELIAREDVRRVLSQVVDAACNSFARILVDKLRCETQDEQANRALVSAPYADGWNDRARSLILFLNESMAKRIVAEQVTDACVALVEVSRG